MKEKANKEKIIAEYLSGKVSYRKLQKRYGFSRSTINEWVMEQEGRGKKQRRKKGRTEGRENVRQLKKALQETELRNKVLNAMLDIGKEQYGIDLRKKPGTKRS
jgi:transposase-like protein